MLFTRKFACYLRHQATTSTCRHILVSLFSQFTILLNLLDILDIDSARFELDDLSTWIQGRPRGSPARTFQFGVSSPT